MRTPEMERIYRKGMEYFQAARWEEALGAFKELQAAGDTSVELEKLIAHTELKAEVARTAMPEGTLPPIPQRRTVRLPLVAIGVSVGIALIAIIALLLRPAPASPVVLAPTTVPTIQTFQRVVPTPVTAPPPTTPRTGSLLVRMANGQKLTTTISNIEIILDASGSMEGLIGDIAKIDIAHGSLETLIRDLPDNTNIALRTYGHRRTADCSDIELVAPLMPLNREDFVAKIRSVRPVSLSRTPMEAALRATADDLMAAQGETLVILVSDGDETCGGDPASAAADLHATHPNIRVSVIGFNVGPDEWRGRLRAIAEQGGGSYFDAADASQLVAALQQAVQLNYRVLDPDGQEVYSGPVGTSVEALPAGEYTVEVGGAVPLRIQRIRVSGKLTTIELLEQGGTLMAQVLRR